jgi:hypothetical protein
MMVPDGVRGWLFAPVYLDHGGPLSSRPFELAHDAHFYSDIAKRWIDIPQGYRSDLLTVPWAFRWLIPRAERGRRAAWVHDWLCDTRPDWCDSTLAHRILDETLRLEPGVPAWKRRAIMAGVWIGGPRWK